MYIEILSGEYVGWKGYKYYDEEKGRDMLQVYMVECETKLIPKKHAYREITKHESLKHES